MKTENDEILAYHLVAYKVAPQTNISLSYSNNGDPATVTITCDLLVDDDGNLLDLTLLPEEVVADDLQAIVQAMAGYYNDAFEKVAATSPFNEVIMLLAMKKNKEAWEKASQLDTGSAREYYVKAIAANRMEKVGEALMYIEKALELDPSLLETARVDGDIIDLLPEEQKIKNDNTTKE